MGLRRMGIKRNEVKTMKIRGLFLACLALLYGAADVSAGLPDPGVVFYGPVTVNGVPADAGVTVTVTRAEGGPALASHILGQDPDLAGQYTLRIPGDVFVPGNPGAVHPGDEVLFFIDGTPAGTSAVGPRGSVTKVPLDTAFENSRHTITASTGPNGSIVPAGGVPVNHGATQIFSLVPDTGFMVEDLIIDGLSSGPATTYTFRNVIGDRSIHGIFGPARFTITSSAGPNGAIDPAGDMSVVYGATPTFHMLPAAGFHVADVLVDGVSAGAVASYTFPPVESSHTIAVTFSDRAVITATAGPNGAITPAGDTAVLHGADQTYTFTPDDGYEVKDVLVDGVTVGAPGSYTFHAVRADHAIAVVFGVVTCPWYVVDGQHAEACIASAEKLRVCLADAGGDGKHNVIMLARGTYEGTFGVTVGEPFDLSVLGGYDDGCGSYGADPLLTVLDGSGAGPGGPPVLLVDASGTSAAVTAESFAVINGAGGGVVVTTREGAVSLNALRAEDSTAAGFGGGIRIESTDGDIVVTNTVLRGNAAAEGGGFWAGTETGRIVLVHDTLTENQATGAGGGAVLSLGAGAEAVVANSIVWGNGTAGAEVVIESDADGDGLHAPVTVTGSDIGPGGLTVTDPAFAPGAGVVDLAPGFAGAGDVHLSADSPLVDLGVQVTRAPILDMDGNPRVAGAGPDIGADELMPAGLPDLLVSAEGGAVGAPAGITGTAAVMNGGDGPVHSPVDVTVYLSRDGAFGPDDRILSRQLIDAGSLGPGMTRRVKFVATGLRGNPDGLRVIVVVDEPGHVVERDETNNTRVFPVAGSPR